MKTPVVNVRNREYKKPATSTGGSEMRPGFETGNNTTDIAPQETLANNEQLLIV